MVAVLTGDIVGYTSLPTEEQARIIHWKQDFLSDFRSFGEPGISRNNTVFNNSSEVLQIEIFRGDSFQALLKNASTSIRLALLFRAFFLSLPVFIQAPTGGGKTAASLSIAPGLIANKNQIENHVEPMYGNIDARVSIGIGDIAIENATLLLSDGEAFRYSGRAFDAMNRKGNHIVFTSSNEQLNLEINTFLTLIEAIISTWTSSQALIIYYKLYSLKEQEIADRLQIKQPTVNRQAKAARWYAIEEFLTYFEQVVIQKIS